MHLNRWLVLGLSLLLSGLSFGLRREGVLYYQSLTESGMLESVRDEKISPSLAEKARQMTVRILFDSGAGSGVIVEQVGRVYTVLTNHHVLANSSEDTVTILTADGQTHPAQKIPFSGFADLDLALVQFTSPQSYPVASISASPQVSLGDRVYATGFPNWHWITEQKIENTHDWGIKAFRFTEGRVGMLPKKALSEGYQLGYTNEIAEGMSGGPVFNSQGELVGINGRKKYPLGGIEGFQFVDGSIPPESVFKQMESLSWGIPITRFQATTDTLKWTFSCVPQQQGSLKQSKPTGECFIPLDVCYREMGFCPIFCQQVQTWKDFESD